MILLTVPWVSHKILSLSFLPTSMVLLNSSIYTVTWEAKTRELRQCHDEFLPDLTRLFFCLNLTFISQLIQDLFSPTSPEPECLKIKGKTVEFEIFGPKISMEKDRLYVRNVLLRCSNFFFFFFFFFFVAVRFGRVPKKEKAKIMEQMQKVNTQSQVSPR